MRVTETYEDDLLFLVTHVETAAEPTADGDAIPAIYRALEGCHLLPDTHIVDTYYLDAGLLVASQQD